MKTPMRLQQAVDAIRRNRLDEAVTILREVLDSMPDQQHGHWLMLQCLRQKGDKAGAERHLGLFLRHTAGNLKALNQAAEFAFRNSLSLDPVLAGYQRYLEQQPDNATAHFNHAWYLGKDGRFAAAVTAYEQALRLGIAQPEEVHLNIANLYMDHLDDDEQAERHLRQALEMRPDYYGAHFNLGGLAEQRGDREEAERRFEKCLEIDPANEAALARLADAHRFESGSDPLLERLDAAARKDGGSSDLHFALGRARESVGAYDAAWRHFERANTLDRASFPPYRPAEVAGFFGSIARQCSPDWLARFPGESHRAVFICGMFRTGSTLLEQALASHPAFTAGGESEFFPRLVARELPAFPDGLAEVTRERLAAWRDAHAAMCSERQPGPGRFIDKRPDNFLYLGFIRAVLPSARFIVTERDWRDVATSIYSTRLGAGQNYATDLGHIRHYIALQERLVEHWSSVLGASLVRIRYEELVTRPRETLGGLLDHLGEDWDERCLDFTARGRTVKTASVWQVREPLHSKSVGRWKNYAEPFRQTFGDSLDAALSPEPGF